MRNQGWVVQSKRLCKGAKWKARWNNAYDNKLLAQKVLHKLIEGNPFDAPLNPTHEYRIVRCYTEGEYDN